MKSAYGSRDAMPHKITLKATSIHFLIGTHRGGADAPGLPPRAPQPRVREGGRALWAWRLLSEVCAYCFFPLLQAQIGMDPKGVQPENARLGVFWAFLVVSRVVFRYHTSEIRFW